jgi:hypothetical protein
MSNVHVLVILHFIAHIHVDVHGHDLVYVHLHVHVYFYIHVDVYVHIHVDKVHVHERDLEYIQSRQTRDFDETYFSISRNKTAHFACFAKLSISVKLVS